MQTNAMILLKFEKKIDKILTRAPPVQISQVVQILVENGADVHIADKFMKTAFTRAVDNSQLEVRRDGYMKSKENLNIYKS